MICWNELKFIALLVYTLLYKYHVVWIRNNAFKVNIDDADLYLLSLSN